jgi:catechol 2,3-dioxygenase-like lactoylglutathione lyase family enzyme
MAHLHHAGISVGDLNRTVAWYGAYFDARETKRFEKQELEIVAAVLELESGTIEVLAPYTPTPAHGTEHSLVEVLRPMGANHLAIAVRDLARIYEKMTAAGETVVTELVDGRFFFCKDPDGTLLEVKQA